MGVTIGIYITSVVMVLSISLVRNALLNRSKIPNLMRNTQKAITNLLLLICAVLLTSFLGVVRDKISSDESIRKTIRHISTVISTLVYFQIPFLFNSLINMRFPNRITGTKKEKSSKLNSQPEKF
jgi:ABC-type transport system involved in multi-copper enzyme maturation permease subunit